MRRLALWMTCLWVATIASAQTVATRVSGHLDGIGRTVVYQVMGNGGRQVLGLDSTAVVDGAFSFTVEIGQPVSLFLSDSEHCHASDEVLKGLVLMLLPGENIVVSGNLDVYTMGGTPFYDSYAAFWKPIADMYKDATIEKYDSLGAVYSRYCMDYIVHHPDDEVSVALLGNLSDENFGKAMQILSPAVLNGRMAPLWKWQKQQVDERARGRAEELRVGVGTEAPNFVLPSLEGGSLELASLRGKYVVLDFWGSWCAPCMMGMPKMKEYWQKYSGRFELLGIDCHDTAEKWQKAVAQKGMGWKQLRQDEGTQDVAKDYVVQGFPTKVVIAPDGQIVYRSVGEDSEFYGMLDKLFGH